MLGSQKEIFFFTKQNEMDQITVIKTKKKTHGGQRLKKMIKKREREKENHWETRWVLKHLQNAAEQSVFLIVCGMAFQRALGGS